MKFSSLCLLAAGLLFVAQLQAGESPRNTVNQNDRTCGSAVMPVEMEQWISAQKAAQNRPLGVQYTIPVVVHVIHNGQNIGTGANISNAQIISQINILNQDFNRTNPDTGSVPTVFKPFAAAAGITFCPAVTDPQGNVMAEPGVHRVNRNDLGLNPAPYSASYIDTAIKPRTIWDPNEYLNIWVVTLGSGLLGYATFPAAGTSGLEGIPGGSTLISDGVVILNTAFGNSGSAQAPYNKGRTTTHEVGHWLGLRHIWGDANCGNDYVDDTPTQREPNYGCPSFPHITCGNGPNGDMFMNFMDYGNDICMYLFTIDQKERMLAILNGSPFRKNVIESNRCNVPSAVDAELKITRPVTGDSSCAAGIIPQVQVENSGSTPLTSFTIEYSVDGGTVFTYPWTGSISFGNSLIITLPAVAVPALGDHSLEIRLVNPNGAADPTPANNSATVNFKRVIAIPSVLTPPYSEGFQTPTTFPPAGWKYTPPNPDYRWRRYAFAGGFGQSTASIRMDNYSSEEDISGQRDILELPAFDFSAANNTLRVRFDVAYARWDNTTNDSLNLYISTDCGMTWDHVYSKGGTQLATAPDTEDEFIPTASQWRKDSVSLAAYAGMSPVLMRIENHSNWGNYLYLDNINVLFSPVALAPVANFTLSDDTICAGASLTLTDVSTNAPTSWSWTMPDGDPATSNAQNPTVSYVTTGTKTITLVATNATGSSAPVSKTVTVVTKPEISVNTPEPVCAGTPVILTAGGATTYSWSPGTGLNPTTGATVQATPATTTTYTVTGTTAGCSSSIPVTVTILPLPTAPVISKNGDTLTSSYSTGNQWYLDGNILTGETGQTYIVTQPGDYTVTHTDDNSCESTSAITTVTSVGISAHIAKDFTFEALPNPNDGIFTLVLNYNKTGSFKLQIRNVLGQLLLAKDIRITQRYSEVFDLTMHGKGMYFISVEKEGKVLNRKVLVD